jgi:protein-L-isoaspartate(D-aspartate) O-methyltransferase
LSFGSEHPAAVARSLVIGLLAGGCTKLDRREPPSVVRPAAPSGSSSSDQLAIDGRRADREAMVAAMADDGIRDPVVLHAMRTVPRHAFVLASLRKEAYADRPLPIVGGQTISQPYVVAFMTQAVRPTRSSVCLEIGTGSGYQAAVLAEICRRTYSIEYLPEVARFGAENLREAGYGPDRVSLRVGDGHQGWPEAAPFDVIVVTAAPETVPQPLLDQLALGGRLVIPVGAQGKTQSLERWTRVKPGQGTDAFRNESLLGVRFVPFLGEAVRRR